MPGRDTKSNSEQDSTPSATTSSATNSMATLDRDTARAATTAMPLNEIAKIARTSKLNRQLFQPLINEAKAVHSLLTTVVVANSEELATLVKANIALLFKKGKVSDPDDTTFYNVSPYQLLTFLCDDDINDKIVPLIPEAYEGIRRKQYAEIASGGADLVKMDRDPTTLSFEDIKRFITSYNLYGPAAPPTAVNFSLLENEDGIIFFNNQFYYANQKTQTVALIALVVDTVEERSALDQLTAIFTDMEMNSSRRSNDTEHQLIAGTLHHELIRRGITYERNEHGADLVKMKKDPLSLPFTEIASLLENPDGILFFYDQFYYANKKNQTVALIKPAVHSQNERVRLDELAAMTFNSRRSTNAEHQLIVNMLGHELERNVISYCDSRADFNRLLNAYRKCIRLFHEQRWSEGDDYWRRGLGGAQREVMWVLQRICEEGRRFIPLPDNFKVSPFLRGFNTNNYNELNANNYNEHRSEPRIESVFTGSVLHRGFGSDFAIYKGAGVRGGRQARTIWPGCDLVAVWWLVEGAKANVAELTDAQDLQPQNTDENLHRGPG